MKSIILSSLVLLSACASTKPTPKFKRNEPVKFVSEKGFQCYGEISSTSEHYPYGYIVFASCMIPFVKDVYMESEKAKFMIEEERLSLNYNK